MATPMQDGNKLVLSNDKVYVSYDAAAKHIFARDLTDLNNEPACYNTKKRSHKKAWAAIVADFTPTTTHHNVMDIMRMMGVGCHYWCMMD